MRIFVLIVLVAAACDGGSGGVSPDEIASEVGQVTCRKLSECCTPTEFMTEALGADTEAECVAIITGFGAIAFGPIQDSIDAGRVKYDGEKLAACIDLVADASCTEFAKQRRNDFIGPGNGCEDPFDGQVGDNGACANDVDCVSNYCSGDSVDLNGKVTMGACKAAPVAGMPCDDSECTSNAWCNAGTCAAPKPDGMACTSDNQCASDSCNGSPGVCGAASTCDGM